MWTTDTIWFDIAMVSMLFAVGNILLGHCEIHTPKLRRIGKYVLTIIIIVCLSIYVSQVFALSLLGLSLLPVIYIHTVLLPKKGIHGWTGEPREKYYELRGWDKQKMH